jgi:hypothetical protein
MGFHQQRPHSLRTTSISDCRHEDYERRRDMKRTPVPIEEDGTKPDNLNNVLMYSVFRLISVGGEDKWDWVCYSSASLKGAQMRARSMQRKGYTVKIVSGWAAGTKIL